MTARLTSHGASRPHDHNHWGYRYLAVVMVFSLFIFAVVSNLLLSNEQRERPVRLFEAYLKFHRTSLPSDSGSVQNPKLKFDDASEVELRRARPESKEEPSEPAKLSSDDAKLSSDDATADDDTTILVGGQSSASSLSSPHLITDEFEVIPGRTYKLAGGGFGRDCNQLLILAMSIQRAIDDDFTLVVVRSWFPILNDLDLELFQRVFKSNFVFATKKIDYKSMLPFFNAGPSYWCALRIPLPVLRSGFRPHKRFRDAAIADHKRIRATTNGDIVSVHVRNYDGLCEWRLPDSCEWSANYQFKPKPYGCNQTLTQGYLDWIRSDWPEHEWKKLAIYLSTDRQSQAIDNSYILGHKSFQKDIENVFEPSMQDGRKYWNEYKKGSQMLQDMWMSVLSDFYVGMPRSSCDKIVAEWRAAERTDIGEDRVHPRNCYRKYFLSSDKLPRKAECPHTRFVGLNTTGFASPTSSLCAMCDLLLSFAAAHSKSKQQGMGLILYGEHGHFIEEHFDLEKAAKQVAFIHIHDHDDTMLLMKRLQPPESSKMRGSGVEPTTQIECTRGKFLNALANLTIRPSEKIRNQVADELAKNPRKNRRARANDCLGSHARNSFCERSSMCDETIPKFDPPAEYTESWTFVHEIWSRVLAETYDYDHNSPCTQVIALWRHGLGKKDAESSNCCVRGYSSDEAEEPESISSIGIEGSATVWTCP